MIKEYNLGTICTCETGRKGRLIYIDPIKEKYLLRNADGDFLSEQATPSEIPSKEWIELIDKFVVPYITTKLYKATCEILADNYEKLHNCPGSDGEHHWCKLGLLSHILGVAENAEILCNKYKFLNRESMIFGAITHDIGKTKDYIWNSN
jgi:3'-5' exoribonuclease